MISLSDPIIELFSARAKDAAIRWLMDELGKHVWEAKIRRINWEEFKTLSVVPKQVFDEIVKDIREQRQAAGAIVLLSPEEEAFFKFFEEQMQS